MCRRVHISDIKPCTTTTIGMHGKRHPGMTLHLSILIGAFIELNISSFHINNTTEEIVGTVILSRGHKPFYQFHGGEINLYYKLQPAK